MVGNSRNGKLFLVLSLKLFTGEGFIVGSVVGAHEGSMVGSEVGFHSMILIGLNSPRNDDVSMRIESYKLYVVEQDNINL